MKINLAIIAALFVFGASCKEFTEQNHGEAMTILRDSIFKAYPTVPAIHIEPQGTLLFVTIGDRQLYKADKGKQLQMANEVAAMTLRIFGKGTDIEDEKLTITPNERNEQAEPADGIVVAKVSIDSLKKVGAK